MKSILVCVSKGLSYQEVIAIVLKLPEKWFVVLLILRTNEYHFSE